MDVISIFSLLMLLGGCAPALNMRAPDASTTAGKLVVMESNVEVGELTALEGLVLRPDWTRAAQANVEAAVRARASAGGARLLDPQTFEESEYTRFYRWAYRSLPQVSARVAGRAYKEVQSVTQWRYDRSLETWRSALGADHLLVIWFRDAHESGGKAVLNLIGTVQVHPVQVGVACWVDLASGRFVWCDRREDSRGDLRKSASAKKAVDQLLKDLLPPDTSNR